MDESDCCYVIQIVNQYGTPAERNKAILPWLKKYHSTFDVNDKCWLIKRIREHGLPPYDHFQPIMNILDTWIEAWYELKTNEEWCFSYYYGDDQNIKNMMSIMD